MFYLVEINVKLCLNVYVDVKWFVNVLEGLRFVFDRFWLFHTVEMVFVVQVEFGCPAGLK